MMHAALDLNIKEVVGFYLFSLSLRSRCAVLLLLQCMRPFVMLWTGAPGDRQKVDGGSPSR
jgi:hypothetical protein